MSRPVPSAHTRCGRSSRPSGSTTGRTAADYQLWHALATIATGFAAARWESGAAAAAGWCFVAGTLVFSGSLYALAVTDRRKLGAITPIGGVLFLIGWALLVVAALTA